MGLFLRMSPEVSGESRLVISSKHLNRELGMLSLESLVRSRTEKRPH